MNTMRLPVALLYFSLASCATIVSRERFHVPIDSVPPGATVSYQDANVGVTPCTVEMRRACSQVTLKMLGYHDQVLEVGRGSNAWILGNILFGGVVGVVVDMASGATGTITEDPCWVELTPSADPRPGTWVRPPPPRSPSEEDEGWIPEGEVSPQQLAREKPKPTRAGPWIAPPPRAVSAEEEGWVRHGTGY